tara:strand:- start:32 stop:1024 length:993 start_codon:yes stop_codon:yes gene_type:complete
MNIPVIEIYDNDRICIAHKQINIRSNIHFLDKIDTFKQEYLCNIRITSTWEISKQDQYYTELLNNKNKETDFNKKEAIFEIMWKPELFFTNIVRTFKEDKWYKIENINNKLFVTENMNVLGKFSGIFKLNRFPFDIQELNITLQSRHPSKELLILPFGHNYNKFSAKESFKENNEWKIIKDINYIITKTPKEQSSSSTEYPQITFKFEIKRKSGYYFWNIMFINFLLCLCSFTSFSIDKEYIGDKLNVSSMTLLTLIAVKFSTSQCIPRVSYLTLLDSYFIFCIFFQMLVIIQNSLHDIININNYDTYSIILLGGILVIFNLYFFIKTKY